MAAFTATNFTITVEDRQIEGKKRRNRCILLLGTEADFHPVGGIPLPTYASWGLNRNIDYIDIYGQPQDGYVWKYSASAHTLVGYRMTCGTISVGTDVDAATALSELATDLEILTRQWYCEAVGW